MKVKLLQVREATPIQVNSPQALYEQMREEAKADREIFWVIHLNTRNKIIEKEIVAMGNLDGCQVHPREIFRKAIILSSKSIITVHNHPSGDKTPSKEDFNLWSKINNAGEILGIDVLDHLIITADSYYSFREVNRCSTAATI